MLRHAFLSAATCISIALTLSSVRAENMSYDTCYSLCTKKAYKKCMDERVLGYSDKQMQDRCTGWWSGTASCDSLCKNPTNRTILTPDYFRY
jgi:hypothetical protein